MKYVLFLLTLMISSILSAQINTPAPSPAATVSQVIGLAKVNVAYSRPSLKGRQLIGSGLIPYGQIWRTGANKIPVITIDQEVKMEGNVIPAGTYGLATIPGALEWTIILTKNADQWGVYNYKQSEDLVRFVVPSNKLATKEEHFTIDFTEFTATSAKMRLLWEYSSVSFKIEHDVDAPIMAEIKAKTEAKEVSADTYFDAANYYYENGKDLNVAMDWANKVLDNEKKYWTYYLRAKIAAKLGNCELAVADGKKGLEMALKDKDNAYILNFQKVFQDCGK